LPGNDVLETKELFEVLAREHSRMLIAYLRAVGCDQALADDVWQETMMIGFNLINISNRGVRQFEYNLVET